MRALLAAPLLLALLLAGCTAGSDNGPKSDPLGTKSYPPLPDSNTTGPPTAPPNATASSSSSSTYTTGLAPQDQEDTAADDAFPGLGVSGRVHVAGGQARLQATANDYGGRTYRIPDDGCGSSFTQAMTGPDGSAVAFRKPAASCTPALRDLQPGQYVSADFVWNGTLWDQASGTFVPAPVGTYTWSVTLSARQAGSTASDPATALTLQFQVHVQ